MTFIEALGLVRLMIARGIPREDAVKNPAVPEVFRKKIEDTLNAEDNITLEPARMLVADQNREDWLKKIDRSEWYYWPVLREYLIGVKNRAVIIVRELDKVTDRILGQLENPAKETFDTRGLVLGYVQSGKTANFAALIAKAADVGYRLIVVLSGVDKGLRRQTQVRLKRELVGYADNRSGAVRRPPLGKQWHEFTSEDMEGDFQPGSVNQAALQMSQPVLLVVKKNGPVLRRLLRWIDEAPSEVKRSIPLLVIDDEADHASIDTRGSYQTEDDTLPPDYVYPSPINRHIRELLHKFQRRAYVAYTATPFANILIPHDTFDPHVKNDLYPKDFIVDLPKSDGYFGAEELFGRFDSATGDRVGGLDIIRDVPDEDFDSLDRGELPQTLETALIDFVLTGSARAQRGQGDLPATMLVHFSRLKEDHNRLFEPVSQRFSELKDEWRYQRQHGIRARLQARWESEFRPVVRSLHLERDVPFEQIESYIGPFFESVEVRVINSASGEVLDYEREPGLKAIAVGGNRLSRGLTLEGLLISYFVRRSELYDTLMQMGRWFGYRGGYEDLTRIYTTQELASWFSDLAFVEHRLREDLDIYESQGMTPAEVGMRIWQHPTMQVTSRLKRRYALPTTISQSYSFALEQTFKFPLHRLGDLALQAEENLQSVRQFISEIGAPQWSDKRPLWSGVSAEKILEFLRHYRVDSTVKSIELDLIRAYIERQLEKNELIRWTVAVRGRKTLDEKLGIAEWSVTGGHIYQIRRTKLNNTDSLGVITDPEDEAVGFSDDEMSRMQAHIEAGKKKGHAARLVRSPQEGLLMLYPISRYSGYEGSPITDNRRPLFNDPESPQARDLIGIALSFPKAGTEQQVEAYLEGTVGWRPVE